jgi:predicted transcriptional regulator
MNRTSLGELQYAIMRVLWEEREASVSTVWESLPQQHQRALTTIATMLSKMERKGVVRHRAEGRHFIYLPTVTEAEVHRTMVAELTERLFQGDAAALVAHLIEEQEIEGGELERLQRVIRAAKKRERGNGR